MPADAALTGLFQEVKRLLNSSPQGSKLGDPEPAQRILPLLAARLLEPAVPLTPENLPKRLCRLQEQAPAAFPKTVVVAAAAGRPPEDQTGIMEILNRLPPAARELDPFSAAFQVFQTPGRQSRQGQYFTPPRAADQAMELLAPEPGQSLLDPACGAGALLAAARRWQSREFPAKAPLRLAGWDTDPQALAYAQAQLAILDPANPGEFTAKNGLLNAAAAPQALFPAGSPGTNDPEADWDLIAANPPFGGSRPVTDPALLQNYRLGHKWAAQGDGGWQPQQALRPRQQPQILFLERCLQLLKPGGRLALILPDGHLSNPQDQYLREYMTSQAALRAVFSLPPDAFQPYTGVKASLLLLEKGGKPRPIRMALPPDANKEETDPAEFPLPPEEVVKHIYAPGYYHPELQAELNALRAGGEFLLTSLQTLQEQGLIAIERYPQIPPEEYGGGEIPLIRTSDLANWEVNEEPKHRVSRELYAQVKERQDLQPGDLLLAHDGSYLIGKTALITKLDTEIVLQSHLRKIRVLQPARLDPHYLLYLLNCNIVRRQMKAKTFVQGTLATLGDRLPEVLLPFAADPAEIEGKTKEMTALIQARTAARARQRQALAVSL